MINKKKKETAIEKEYVLKNWSLIANPLGVYRAPETISLSAQGEVFNNPNFKEGERITTSTIQNIEYNDKNEPIKIKTRNSEYLLENISEQYKIFLDTINNN